MSGRSPATSLSTATRVSFCGSTNVLRRTVQGRVGTSGTRSASPDLAEDAHRVAADGLRDVVVAVVVLDQPPDDVREVPEVLQAAHVRDLDLVVLRIPAHQHPAHRDL